MLTGRSSANCGQTQEAETAGALLSPPWKGNEATLQSAGNEAAQLSLIAYLHNTRVHTLGQVTVTQSRF